MDRKFILIIGLILVVLALIGGGFLWWSMKPNAPVIEPSISPTPVSSPEVIPTPEETPSEEEGTKSDLEQIREAFAEKYNRSVSEVDATIDNNTGTHANGLVRFAGEIGGGWWLAYNDGTGWIIVADGNGSVLCDDIEGYNFPTNMVPECWDEATNTLIQL